METNGTGRFKYSHDYPACDLAIEMRQAYKKGVFLEVRNDPFRQSNIFTVILNGNYRLGDTDDPAQLIHDYLESI